MPMFIIAAFVYGIGLGAVIFGAVATVVGCSQMYLWASIQALLAFILYFAIATNKMPDTAVEETR